MANLTFYIGQDVVVRIPETGRFVGGELVEFFLGGKVEVVDEEGQHWAAHIDFMIPRGADELDAFLRDQGIEPIVVHPIAAH